MSSCGPVPWKSHPQSNSCTKRTPFSTSRRASRQLLAKLAPAGSAPYSASVSFDSRVMSITSGTEVCIRNASSYCATRVAVSGFWSCSSSIAFKSCSTSRVRRRIARSMPGGSETYSTGSPFERHCTPWNTDGMKPLPQQFWPPLGWTPLEISTTNPGRSSFSEPSP